MRARADSMSHPRLVAPCVLARGLTLDSSSPSDEGAMATHNSSRATARQSERGGFQLEELGLPSLVMFS